MPLIKNLSRSAIMMLMLCAGYLFPQLHNSQVIRYNLMAMLFVVFLQQDLGAVKGYRSTWRVLAANFSLAFLAYFTMRLAASEELAKAAFWICIAPTAVAAPPVTNFLGGDMGFVITSVILTNFAIPASLPLLLPLFEGKFDWLYFLKVALNIAALIGIPCAAAKALDHFTSVDCRKLGRKLNTISYILWNISLFFIASNASDFISRHNSGNMAFSILKIAALSCVCCVLNFTVGYLIGDRKFRTESSQALGQKNTTMTIYLALTYAGPIAALGPTSYVFWHNLWNAVQLYRHGNGTKQEK